MKHMLSHWTSQPPPANDMSFSAAVYEPQELPSGFDDEMAVLIAELVPFAGEFRCFFLDRRVPRAGRTG